MLAQSVFVLFLTVLGVWSTSGFHDVQNETLSSDNASPETNGTLSSANGSPETNGSLSSKDGSPETNGSLSSDDGSPKTSKENCSYHKVLEYLNLTKENDLYFMNRPVKDHKDKTPVFIEMYLYAILDVREIDQTFVSYVWLKLEWYNEHISWNPKDFCGIENLTVPNQVLWKPDLTIEEMIERDKAPPSPLVRIYSSSWVYYENDQVIISSCRMHVFKFPFDTQSCTITFKSILLSDEIDLLPWSDGAKNVKWLSNSTWAQYEWVYKNMFYNRTNTTVIYTIIMSRRPTLYCFNFLLPILFLIILDLASFLIPSNGGEKLSFKVTVLLAVTVMQLILNEILPSSTNTIPLVVLYCVGTFALMLLSVIETIVVMHLMEKDSESPDSEGDPTLNGDQNEEKIKVNCRNSLTAIHDHETDQNTPSPKKDSSSQRLDVSLALDLFSHELDEVKKTVSLLNSRRENTGYWTKLSKKIHKIFTVCYVGGVILFLFTISMLWIVADED